MKVFYSVHELVGVVTRVTCLLHSSDKGEEPTLGWRSAVNNGRNRTCSVGVLVPKICISAPHTSQRKREEAGKRPVFLSGW
jgi:hypothetical protein